MSEILSTIVSQLKGPALESLASSVGTDESSTQTAIATALPLLMKALANNTSDGKGASALAKALDNDHDGSVLSDLGGLLSSDSSTSTGQSILKHVLGSKSGVIADAIGKSAGLDSSNAGVLIAKLAPLVMGYLGKAKREENLDSDGLSALLKNEAQTVEKKGPKEMSMLTSLLDSDNDGNVSDDLVDLGSSLLKSFLK